MRSAFIYNGLPVTLGADEGADHRPADQGTAAARSLFVQAHNQSFLT